MAKPGPRPRPTHLNVIAGTYDQNPQRRPENEPEAPQGWPQIPDGIDEVAKCKFWDTCRQLDELGILSPVYADAIEAYATTYSDYRRASEMVAKIGIAIVGKDQHGNAVVKRNPFMTAKRQCLDAMLKYEAEFGLTPSSKSRISTDATSKDDQERKFSGA